MRKAKPLAERFYSHVEKKRKCWLWTGGVGINGAGRLGRTDGGSYQAPRIAWEIAGWEIPEGKVLGNLCGNVRCVRPEHYEVTDRETLIVANTATTRTNTKLSARDVRRIRRLVRPNAAALAREYGVSACTVRNILKRRTWKDV